MVTDAESVLVYLRRHQDEWQYAVEIARAVGLPTDRTQVQVRSLITELIDRGYPIVSSGKGFMLTHSPEEHVRYLQELGRRRNGLDRRIKAAQNNYWELTL